MEEMNYNVHYRENRIGTWIGVGFQSSESYCLNVARSLSARLKDYQVVCRKTNDGKNWFNFAAFTNGIRVQLADFDIE